jgi:hypothetical protein
VFSRNSFIVFIVLIVTYVAQQCTGNALLHFSGNGGYANARQYYKYIACLVHIILPPMSESSKWLETLGNVCCNSMLGL